MNDRKENGLAALLKSAQGKKLQAALSQLDAGTLARLKAIAGGVDPTQLKQYLEQNKEEIDRTLQQEDLTERLKKLTGK